MLKTKYVFSGNLAPGNKRFARERPTAAIAILSFAEDMELYTVKLIQT